MRSLFSFRRHAVPLPAMFVSLTAALSVPACAASSLSQGSVSLTPSTSDATPSISKLIPASASAGGGSFTLTVIGASFRLNSIVDWNGSPLPTSYVDATELRASVSPPDIATAGFASVIVVNPSENDGTSSSSEFTIKGTVPASERFVAPDGSDTNPGTISRPYRTIQKCATTVASGGRCQLRAGTYRETVTPNSGITITSYDGEQVTVDGSDPVTGWTLYKGSIYRAKVTLSSSDTNQIFVGDQMMTEARWPNGDDLFHVNWATAEAGTTESILVDSHLPKINWKGAKIHLWGGTDPFSHQTGVVTTSDQGRITIDIPTIAACPAICPTSGGYYYLFGILGALDTENEWFYDSKAGMLYFWAPGGINPEKLNVRARQRQFAFDLSGKSNVTIENLNLFSSGITSDPSSANILIDGINAQYLSQFTTLPPVPGDTSGFGFITDHWADTGIVLQGTGNILRNSTIGYSAGCGVVVMSTNTSVTNNLIHHVDYMGDYTSGVNFFGTDGSGIENNTIYSAGRAAIYVQAVSNSVAKADIGYNNLFDAMMLSRDGGEIYTCCAPLAVQEPRIHDNWIHDTQSLISGAADDYPLSGVYIDNDEAGFEVDQNVLWNNEYDSIYLHGADSTKANDNYVHNNTIADVSSNAYIWLFQIPDCGTTRVDDNLVLVPANQQQTDPACGATDNSSTAPGATEMTPSTRVGCDFAGCESEGPPKILGDKVGASIAVQPLSATIGGGAKATFTVTAAGSAPLHYQWKRDGEEIPGANSPSYATPPVGAADNGASFTVEVSNTIGTSTSVPAVLTVN